MGICAATSIIFFPVNIGTNNCCQVAFDDQSSAEKSILSRSGANPPLLFMSIF